MAFCRRSFRRDIARVCTCETRDSLMPSVRPIFEREVLVVVQRDHEALLLGEQVDRLQEREALLLLLETRLEIEGVRVREVIRQRALVLAVVAAALVERHQHGAAGRGRAGGRSPSRDIFSSRATSSSDAARPSFWSSLRVTPSRLRAFAAHGARRPVERAELVEHRRP